METDRLTFVAKALLGSVSMSKKAAAQLEVGDILILDQMAKEPMKIQVGHDLYFLGYAGYTNGHKAIKIIKAL